VGLLSIQATDSESARGKKRGDGQDWRRGRGGGRGAGGRGGGGRGGFRAPLKLSDADLEEVKALPGVDALLSKGHSVVVLAIGKARLFYEGNPVVFGGAVGAVFGEPKVC
jgi:hypothetical protein